MNEKRDESIYFNLTTVLLDDCVMIGGNYPAISRSRRPSLNANQIIKFLLGSPLHFLLSNRMMLVTFTGRRTGKAYTTPVNYFGDEAAIWTVSRRERTWWHNLRGGAPVTLRLRGKNRNATGEVIEETSEVIEYLRRIPRYAKRLKVALNAHGRAKRRNRPEDLSNRVIVSFHLS